jgi:hypothetical protein
MALSVGYAFWRGDGPERVTAAAFLAGVAASATLGLFKIPGGFASVPVRLLAIDLSWSIIFTVIAIRANRVWLIPFAGCQIVVVLGHIAKLIDSAMIPKGYALLTVIWSWPMLMLLVWGTAAHQRRVANGILLPSWKSS